MDYKHQLYVPPPQKKNKNDKLTSRYEYVEMNTT